MNIKELHIGMMVLVNSDEPWASDWNGGPYEVVGIHKKRFGIENISLIADGQEYDGMQASDLVLYVPICEVCNEQFMACECPYQETRRVKNDGSKEQLEREINKLKKSSHSSWHIWTKISNKNCKECEQWKPKTVSPTKPFWKKVISPLIKLTRAA
jgi:hypothetical protein